MKIAMIKFWPLTIFCVFLFQYCCAEEIYTLNIASCPIPNGSASLWERIPNIEPECLRELQGRDSINVYQLDSRPTATMNHIPFFELVRLNALDSTMTNQYFWATLPGELVYFSENVRNQILGLYHNGSLIYSFLAGIAPSESVPEAFTVREHWVLRHWYFAPKIVASGQHPAPTIIFRKYTVVVDGEDLCNKYGYDNCYAFRYLNDKPFFIFEREGHVGCSYYGKEYSTPFDEVWHDRCCDESRIGIGFGPHYANFVAHNPADSTWYKVVARVVRQ